MTTGWQAAVVVVSIVLPHFRVGQHAWFGDIELRLPGPLSANVHGHEQNKAWTWNSHTCRR